MHRAIGVAVVGLVALAWIMGIAEGSSESHSAGPPQPGLHFLAEGAQPMTGPLAEALDLELVFELGSLDGNVAFGEIVDLAVSRDSLVAVADRFGCTIRVFAFPSAEPISELGGCGDGPGEFRQVVSVAFKGDTLLVSDFGRARIVRMDARRGEEFSAELPPFPRIEAPVMLLDASHDAVLYVPDWLRTPREELLVVHTDAGQTHEGLTDTEISLTNRELSMTRRTEACHLKGDSRVVVANRWAPQAVILDRELQPLFNHVDERPWVGPREEGGPGHWVPGFVRPRIACADSLAFIRYRTNERVGEHGWRVGLGLVLVVSSSGEIVQREVVADTAWPHPTAMAPAAGMGDVIFLFQNAWGPYPMVRGYRVHQGGQDQ